jgi:hypothetical protein
VYQTRNKNLKKIHANKKEMILQYYMQHYSFKRKLGKLDLPLFPNIKNLFYD